MFSETSFIVIEKETVSHWPKAHQVGLVDWLASLRDLRASAYLVLGLQYIPLHMELFTNIMGSEFSKQTLQQLYDPLNPV